MTTSEPQHPLPGVLSKMTLDDKPSSTTSKVPNDVSIPIEEKEQIINPFEVIAADENGIDYDKVIEKFGTRRIDQAMLDRFEKSTGHKPHRYLTRGHFFSQR